MLYLWTLLFNLSGKINLKRSDKYVALSNVSIYYTWKKIKKSYKNNKLKILAPTWNKEFELPDIHDFWVYYQKTVTDNPSVIYVNK